VIFIVRKITPSELKRRLKREELIILDIRTKEKFMFGHLKHPKAKNINVFKEDIFKMEQADIHSKMPFSKHEEVVITCTSGNSATRCANILQGKGYNVKVLKGGIVHWNKYA